MNRTQNRCPINYYLTAAFFERHWVMTSGACRATALCVRASFEEPLFGRWNYPVGVTLYGLLQAGQTLCNQEVSLYALSHIGQCLDYADYSVWELNTYGFPAVNNQWAKLEMLDDCGAFGIAVMEALKGLDSFQARKLSA